MRLMGIVLAAFAWGCGNGSLDVGSNAHSDAGKPLESVACTAENHTCDATSICNAASGRCVPLLTETCTQILAESGQTSGPNDVVFGAVFASPTEASASGSRGLQLALRDFAAVDDLPPVGAGSRRHLRILVCNTSPDGADDALRHLSQDVGTRVILGDELVAQHGPAFDATVLTPSSPVAVGRSQGKVVSLGTPPSADAEVLLLKFHEKVLREAGLGGSLKVALLESGLEEDRALDESFVMKAGASYTLSRIGIGIAANQAAFDDGMSKIAAATPDVVACFGHAPCDKALTVIERNGQHPRYVFRPVASLFDVTVPAEVGRRVLGTRAGRPLSAAPMAGFSVRFRTTFPDAPSMAEVLHAAHFYDLAYVGAYACVAAGRECMGGFDGALERFSPDGTPLTAAPQDILKTFDAIAQNRAIRMDGTTALALFNADGSLQTYEQAVWCLGTNGDFKDAGLSYRSGGDLQGTWSCP